MGSPKLRKNCLAFETKISTVASLLFMFTKLVSVHAWRDVAEKTPWPAWWLVGSRGPPPAKPDRKLKVDVKPTAGTDNQCTQWLQTVCTQAKGLARRPQWLHPRSSAGKAFRGFHSLSSREPHPHASVN